MKKTKLCFIGVVQITCKTR